MKKQTSEYFKRMWRVSLHSKFYRRINQKSTTVEYEKFFFLLLEEIASHLTNAKRIGDLKMNTIEMRRAILVWKKYGGEYKNPFYLVSKKRA